MSMLRVFIPLKSKIIWGENVWTMLNDKYFFTIPIDIGRMAFPKIEM